ncbi:MAG: isocitrate/isopropylmalate dehydrogenase family protein [Candidatus Hydrothermarchaeota archaeon]
MRISVIEGDGIGPEVIGATIKILKELNLDMEFVFLEAGYECYKKCGESISEEVIETVKETDACLFGATTTPPKIIEGYKSPILTLRKELELYANIRPIKSLKEIRGIHKDVDLIVVRENSEGLYSGIEEELNDGYSAKRIITKKGSERIAKIAFEQARKEKRKKVTIVHKANVLRKTCGLFRDVSLKVGERYQEIEKEECLIDSFCMHLVEDPKKFDVILTTNLFGDIISDIGAGLIGGIGIVPSMNLGDNYALFEPIHGSAPDIAGKGIANPIASILSSCLMLSYLGKKDYAKKIESSIEKVLKRGIKTPDLNGNSSTKEFTESLIKTLREIL